MRSVTVDGNDVVLTAETAQSLIERARRGEGPALLEAVTFRHRGHVGPRDDADVGIRRGMAELQAWKARDPIHRLFAAMRDRRFLDDQGFAALEATIRTEVEECCRRAEAAAYPPESALLDLVFASPAR